MALASRSINRTPRWLLALFAVLIVLFVLLAFNSHTTINVPVVPGSGTTQNQPPVAEKTAPAPKIAARAQSPRDGALTVGAAVAKPSSERGVGKDPRITYTGEKCTRGDGKPGFMGDAHKGAGVICYEW